MNKQRTEPWATWQILLGFATVTIFLIWGVWGNMPQRVWAGGLVIAGHLIAIFAYRARENRQKDLDISAVIFILWVGIFVGWCATLPP